MAKFDKQKAKKNAEMEMEKVAPGGNSIYPAGLVKDNQVMNEKSPKKENANNTELMINENDSSKVPALHVPEATVVDTPKDESFLPPIEGADQAKHSPAKDANFRL